MRQVGLAPASVEQRNARRHASRVSRFLALGNAHQRVDGRGRVRACESLDLGDLLGSAAGIAALALLKGLEIAVVHCLLAVLSSASLVVDSLVDEPIRPATVCLWG